ncbi:MAG: energy transducer TonB [Alphaproteobacteria bacterium]|nr:energy transducer TonB [Alphaproteobacteria bacterium]MCB9796846.1 energy transducer TonB [Alphaproteobacteria bacterium]
MLLHILLPAALAATYDADNFVLEDVNGVTWTVTRYEVPDFGPQDLLSPGEDAWCKMKVRLRERGPEVSLEDCSGALADRSLAAVRGWSGHWGGRPAFVGLFEVSFQLEALADGGVQTWLVVDHDQSEALAEVRPEAVRRWSELELTRYKPARFPKAARAEGIQESTCTAAIRVDVKGKPTEVDVSGCEEVFHEGTVKAALRWRFDPLRIDGVAQEGVYVATVHYRAY